MGSPIKQSLIVDCFDYLEFMLGKLNYYLEENGITVKDKTEYTFCASDFFINALFSNLTGNAEQVMNDIAEKDYTTKWAGVLSSHVISSISLVTNLEEDKAKLDAVFSTQDKKALSDIHFYLNNIFCDYFDSEFSNATITELLRNPWNVFSTKKIGNDTYVVALLGDYRVLSWEADLLIAKAKKLDEEIPY